MVAYPDSMSSLDSKYEDLMQTDPSASDFNNKVEELNQAFHEAQEPPEAPFEPLASVSVAGDPEGSKSEAEGQIEKAHSALKGMNPDSPEFRETLQSLVSGLKACVVAELARDFHAAEPDTEEARTARARLYEEVVHTDSDAFTFTMMVNFAVTV